MGADEIRKLKDKANSKEAFHTDGKGERWFVERRIDMVGICQCGCRRSSQKYNDKYFKHSACHIFPKSQFPSIMYHPLNFVERAFFGGCHTQLDESGIDKWPKMADWKDIRKKFLILEQQLTPEEKTKKFYHALKQLIYEHQ